MQVGWISLENDLRSENFQACQQIFLKICKTVFKNLLLLIKEKNNFHLKMLWF